MSTLEKVKKVVVDQLSCDEALVTPEASFTADLGADSLDTSYGFRRRIRLRNS